VGGVWLGGGGGGGGEGKVMVGFEPKENFVPKTYLVPTKTSKLHL